MDAVSPPVTIRRSGRAKRARMTFTPGKGFELVVPVQVNQAELSAWMAGIRPWMERQVARYGVPQPAPELPRTLVLHAVDEHWAVQAAPDQGRLSVREGCLYLPAAPAADMRRALRGWLQRRSRELLLPRLTAVSEEIGLPFLEGRVRYTRRRWGSCTSERRISLSARLLFLPPPLVRHVMIHELCHTQHLNHSAAFWALVARHDPQWRQRRQAMREAWRYLPEGLEG